MATVRRQIASCNLGGPTVVTMAYDDVTLEFLGLRLRGSTDRRVTMRINPSGRGPLVRTRERRDARESVLRAPTRLRMVRRVNQQGREVVGFPDGTQLVFNWVG